MKDHVIDIITSAVQPLMSGWGLETIPPFEVETPRNESHGDLATNLAMLLAKPLRRSPRAIAEEIVTAIGSGGGFFSSVEIAGAGFINFRFGPGFWHDRLGKILHHDRSFLRPDIGRGARIQVEFVSANPTGPLHIGHGRGAAVGLAVSNLLAAAGYQVEKEFYINDAGRQVKLLGLSVWIRYHEILGRTMEFPEDAYRGDYVIDLARVFLAELGQSYLDVPFEECGEKISDWACTMMLGEIRADLDAFGLTFDSWMSERSLHRDGKVASAMEDLKARNHIYEKDNAVWFSSTAFGDDKDRVVVKADGEMTYFASDIAYHKEKLDRGYDGIIDIWGADHHGYIPRIQAVLEAFDYDVKKFQVILVQIVSLLRHGEPVKMSKRSGDFISLKEVVEEVGPDIAKFIFLTRRSDSHLDFDVAVAKEESSENPVFYVQYAHARINSIFRHAPEKGYTDVKREAIHEIDISYLADPSEIGLIKMCGRYPEIFEAAVRSREPHRITYYLQELAGSFHSYYRHNRILLDDDRDLGRARMALARAVEIVLHEGLSILGVRAPESM